MKPNQKNRYNGRYNNNRTYRPQQQMIFRNTALDSNGPCGKLHGTALQLSEKYQNSSKDAQLQNDSVLAETCLQFADHYMRLQNIAIANEEANRPQQRPQQPRFSTPESNTPTVPTTPVSVSEDELPTFAVPTVESPETAESLSAEDEAIKNMDLSIPISAIQQKHLEPVKGQRPRGPRPMRKPRETTPKSETTTPSETAAEK